MSDKPLCFVIMPFKPELNYFYLYVKQHLESHHPLICKRADDIADYPNKDAFLDTILADIERADVILADCTGGNENVMYELGLAHAQGKKSILITQDAPEETPANIRHKTFIHYNLGDDVSFLAALDKRIQDAFFADYVPVYNQVIELLEIFQQERQLAIKIISIREFIAAVGSKRLITPSDTYEFASRFLPFAIENFQENLSIAVEMNDWILERYD